MAPGTILSCSITGQATSIWIGPRLRICVIGTAELAPTESCYWNGQQTVQIFGCATSTLMAEKRRCAATARAASRVLLTKSAERRKKFPSKHRLGLFSGDLWGVLWVF